MYEVEAALLPALDDIEGAPALFRLGPIELIDQPGPVFAYFYQDTPPPGVKLLQVWENRDSG